MGATIFSWYESDPKNRNCWPLHFAVGTIEFVTQGFADGIPSENDPTVPMEAIYGFKDGEDGDCDSVFLKREWFE